jgi:REP element-mobilizing transposase RayT
MSQFSRHRPVHFYVEGGCYFISAAILRHQAVMHSPERRAWLAGALADGVRGEAGELVAWVVLPDHYHAVIRVPEARAIA